VTSISKAPFKLYLAIAYLIPQRISQHPSTKTPQAPDDLKLLPPPDANNSPICFSTAHIHAAAISSFPHGSGAGPDGLRPQHLKDCISITAGDASTSLLTSLTELVNYLANGHLPTDLRPFLYGAQLHGLCKSNGDLRPITVGCTYRHLVAKSAWDSSSQGSVSSSCPPK